MTHISGGVFGDVFAFGEALEVAVRLQLAALLASPGHPPAILPGQLGRAALPVDVRARAEIRRVVEAGITARTIKTLGAQRLGAIVPALVRCDPAEPARSASPQWEVLASRHAPESAPLAALTLRQISGWPGVGPTRVAHLVGAAVGAALEVVGPERHIPLVVDPIPDDLRRVIAYDAARGAALSELLEEMRSAGPSDVAAAAHRLLSWSKVEPDRCLRVLAQALAAGGDQRDRGVFENGVLPLGPSVTRPELAVAIGLGEARVRQLAVRATARVAAVLGQAPTAIGELVGALSERVGSAAPVSGVDEALTSLGFPPLPDTRSRLLLWMAGPYRVVDGYPGWVALDPAGLVGQTRRLIHVDGGVRPTDHVTKELRAEGVVAEHVGSWLARQPVRVGEGLVVATTGSPGDIAERALHANGRAMTVDEIAQWLPMEPSGLRELGSTRDRRFVLTGGSALALVEWGSDTD